ncbi:MAG: sugar phosphate isomerase/epimerase family protein [Tepidisphaerales bacterium]
MSAPRHVNDGSTRPPRLAIYGNEWAMGELPQWPHDRAWSFEETADRMVAAGFHGIQAGIGNRMLVESRGLRFATSGRVNTPAEVGPHVKAAADAGADCTTLHAGWGMESDAAVDALLDAVNEASARHGLPAYIETHRATIAQDLLRIQQFIWRRPEVRFNGDFSHLYCAGEVCYPGFENVRDHFRPILERVCFFHGRISNGESMQIDVGDGRDNAHVRNFQWLWETGMGHWLARARPGDILPFAPELGPPSSGYSITFTDSAGRVAEISDRWAQTLVLKRLAEECWAQAVESMPRAAPK